MTETRKKIRQKGLQCPNCLQEIYSNYRHDFKYCWCGTCFIDGGLDYQRSGWDPAFATRDNIKHVTRSVTLVTRTESPEEKVNRLARLVGVITPNWNLD